MSNWRVQERNGGKKAQIDRSELKGSIYIYTPSKLLFSTETWRKKKQRNRASMDKNGRMVTERRIRLLHWRIYLQNCIVVSVRLTRRNLSVEYIDDEKNKKTTKQKKEKKKERSKRLVMMTCLRQILTDGIEYRAVNWWQTIERRLWKLLFFFSPTSFFSSSLLNTSS